jgi:hypothetical protein
MIRPLLLVVLLPLWLHAESDAPPLNAEAVLRELEAIEKKQHESLESAKASVVARLVAGAKGGPSAAALYEDAVEAIRFDGLRDKVPAFVEWKKKNADLLRSSEFQTAAGMHLRYLVLSIQRKDSEKPIEFSAPSLEYARELAAKLLEWDAQGGLPGAGKDLLDKPMAEGVFAKWLQLGPWLPEQDAWEEAAGNVAGILEKNVRGPMRAAGDAGLLATYELQMRFEADRITRGRLEHRAATFNTIERPRLQFARAKDMAALGRRNSAGAELLGIVRSYPQHPDFQTWTQTLRQLLDPPPAAPPASPPES